MFGRTKIAMLVAEFLGAASLTAVLLAVSKSGVGFSFFVASAVGLTFALLSLVFGAASGSHFNPALTVGLWTVRKIQTTQAIVYLVAQFGGAVVAGLLYTYLANQKLVNVAAKHFDWRVLVAELVGAFIFTFAVTAAVYEGQRGLKYAATAGGALFLGMLVASLGSNALINPAIAAGIKSWDKAYVLGPLVGGLVGPNLYALLFAPNGMGEMPAVAAVVRATGSRAMVAPVKRPASRARKTTRRTTRRR